MPEDDSQPMTGVVADSNGGQQFALAKGRAWGPQSGDSSLGVRVVAAGELVRESPNGIGCELGGVRGGCGYPADKLHDVIPPDPLHLEDQLR